MDMLLKNLKDPGANINIKVHFLHWHLVIFQESCGDVSDEQWEQFHQNIRTMEKRYQGWWDKRMMADYCWRIKRDLNKIEHENQERKTFYHNSNVHEDFIFAVSLFTDLVKILVGLGIFNHVILKA